MFRPMRRKNQMLSQEESISILSEETSGVLAVHGDDGYPYAVPLSYVYDDGNIYFHCAKKGHKLDAIARSGKASFCVIAQDTIVPEEYTTYFRSVIAFGTVDIIEDKSQKRVALEKLAAKYSPAQKQGREEEIKKQMDAVCMVAFSIEHLSGKEAIELTRMKKSRE